MGLALYLRFPHNVLLLVAKAVKTLPFGNWAKNLAPFLHS